MMVELLMDISLKNSMFGLMEGVLTDVMRRLAHNMIWYLEEEPMTTAKLHGLAPLGQALGHPQLGIGELSTLIIS
jgi:hypothetical protein